MEILAMLGVGLVALIAFASAAWGVFYAAAMVFGFVKAVVDRMNDKEDAYYSKNVDK